MFLTDYIPNLNKKFRKTFFSGITSDSNRIKKDNIFFAIEGNRIDGNKFIPIAIKKGSRVIISEKKINNFKNGVLYIHTKNVRKLLAEVSFKINNKKPKNIIGVTGTNGKSSVADFYYQLMNLNNQKVASIGTLGVKSRKLNLNLLNTTIDPTKLSEILVKLKNQKIENIIMEASSHGLVQNRLDGLKFNSGIFTNLSHDHLDYHKNLNSYFKAKLYLFENLIKNRGNIITDEKIPQFKKIKQIAIKKNLKLITLKDKKNNFELLSHNYKGDIQILKIKNNNSIKEINLNLIGKIQLKNLWMAIIAARKSNLSLNKILKTIPKLRSVEGRLEKIGKIKNKSKVILDYAHTPEALKTSLLSLRDQFPDKKIILLFGCGGNRDQDKRSKMGKIASHLSDKIFLTDDNPRYENSKKIRNEIKKGIKKVKVIEIPNRSKAISVAIKTLNTGEILLVAGKGHEKTQDLGNRKIFFSDRKVILEAIKIKNSNLFNNLKLNIIKELSSNKKFPTSISVRHAKINSKEIKKDDIFFAIKGRKNDGNKFVGEAFKKNASITIVNRIKKDFDHKRQIKVQNTLKFLTNSSKIFRNNINTQIIAITGSCGKTTLKEILGNSLKKISRVSISPKSYNNKYGVPLSLFNISENNDYGVLEVGMDKKGEIDYLSKIIQPNVSVITNINYAHAKNFKNIKQIALAKSEIIHNTKTNGFIILNADDSFFKLHQKIAHKKKLNVISFGIKNHKSNIKFVNLEEKEKFFKLNCKIFNQKKSFLISNDFDSNIYNTLSAISVMSVYIDVLKLNKNIFLNFKLPNGRGDISKIKINKKKN